jgi:SPP1 family predicted phage head-tail adaptor
VRAGKLRHRISVQRLDPAVRDARSWIDLAVGIPASAEPIAGREFVALQAAQSLVSIRFRIRYRADITADMRVVWEGKAYELVGPPIDTAGLHRELQLMCQGDPDA